MTNKEKFDAACALAKQESDDGTTYVNASVQVHDGEPVITGYATSDWFGGATVATYLYGRRQA